MGFQLSVFRFCEIRNGASSSAYIFQSQSRKRCSFGIAFDIDGVILRGKVPIAGSSQALRRLFSASGELTVPFLFLTNGGGVPETRRAKELSELLGVRILPSQVLQGHTSFKYVLKRFENELIVATGKGEPALVMSEYGFKKAVSLEEYASCFEGIDPVSQYKRRTTQPLFNRNGILVSRNDVLTERVKAVFIISDPVDWGRDIQVLCDILTSGGLLLKPNGKQPPLYFAADDLQYQATFPSKRLGIGAFRIALESIFNRIHYEALEYECYGKPNPVVFRNAQEILTQLYQSFPMEDEGASGPNPLETLYMVGDNPAVDIKGAQQAGHPWFSILTRTGVFQGRHNHSKFPADLVVDTVEEAVDYILRKECLAKMDSTTP